MTRLTPVTSRNSRAVGAFRGAKLAGVTYGYLPDADESGYAGGQPGLDADLAAVTFEFSSRDPITATWAMDGDLEGLAFISGARGSSGLADATIEATGREEWRRHRGDTVDSVETAWQISGNRPLESLWAIRLRFACSGPVVIALGTADPDVRYFPDELVVIFDPALASSYRPPHVGDDPWVGSIES